MIRKLIQLQRLRRNLTLSAPQLRALQQRKLRVLVEHAYAHVPYYRGRFDQAGIRPADIRSPDDLRHVPTTTKADLRAAGLDAILTRGCDPSALHSARTSGSTGEPFTTYMTGAEFGLRKMHQLRALLANGLRPWDRTAALGADYTLHQRLGLYRLLRISRSLPIEEQIAQLRAFAPTVLWAYPSVLTALLERAGCRLADLCRPRVLITSAESFEPALAERCLDGLPGLRHLNFYGSVEAGRIAWQCPARRGLHVNVDALILEIEPLEASEGDAVDGLGETVVTALDSWTMPFIRFRQGDLARYLDEPCPCGLSLPTMAPPVGRATDVVRLPSGRVRSVMPLRDLLELAAILRYRIVQKALDRLVIELVAPDGLPEAEQTALARLLRDKLGEPIRIDFHLVERIESQGIKIRNFASELAPTEDVRSPSRDPLDA